jgi:hypothetical protein
MSQRAVGYLMVCEAGDPPQAKPTMVSDVNGVTIIDTVLQEGDRVNRNKRLYKTSVLSEALQSAYILERLKTKTFFGEAGHPLKPDMQRQLTIDHTRISHIVASVKVEGHLITGTVESAQTSCGSDFQGLIRQGSIPAFSMRGIGPIVEEKKDFTEIKSPLSIFAYDWVVHPSHDVAYMRRIIQEAKKAGVQMTAEGKGLGIVLEQAQIDSFLESQSRNVRNVSNNFEIPIVGASVSADARSVIITDHLGVTAKVFLEDHVTRELGRFMLHGSKEEI